MQDASGRQPVSREPLHALPVGLVPLAAAFERAVPEVRDVIPEGIEAAGVRGHRVIGEEPAHHLAQPVSLCGNGLVPSLQKLPFDSAQGRSHPISARLAFQQERTATGATTEVGEAEEREALRFAQATPDPAFGRKAAKLDQASLLWVQQQRELLEPLLQLRQKSPGVGFVLEAGNEVEA